MRGASEKNHGRLSRFAQREQSAEVGISRDYDATFALGAIEDPSVVCRLQPVLAYVNGVMPGLAQTFDYKWRQRVIDQESLEAERSGNSRSRTASAA